MSNFNPKGNTPKGAHPMSLPIFKPHDNLPSHARHYEQNNVVQYNGPYYYPHLSQWDPAQPANQASNVGLERYQSPQNPQSHNGQSEPLLAIVAQHNEARMTETSRLDREVRSLDAKVEERFEEMYGTVTNDLSILRKEFMSLISAKVADSLTSSAQKQIESSGDGTAQKYYDYYTFGADGEPSEETLRDHSPEVIARQYLEEAEKREAHANVLRKKASEMCSELVETMSTGVSKIEAPPAAITQDLQLEFRCCDIAFSAIGELVEHVERTHTVLEHPVSHEAHSKATENKVPSENELARAGIEASIAPKVERKSAEISTQTVTHEPATWIPTAVRNMPPAILPIPGNTVTFSFELLRTTFGGEFWSPGFYYIPKNSILPSRSYWILENDHEPFLPTKPGEHGAKITAFFNETASRAGHAPEEENYMKVPVFIKTSNKDEYAYYGNYSQLRFSDKLGYDTLMDHIPESVLRHHADQLAENGRPEWVTEALRLHFWPKPVYNGPIPTDSALNSPATSSANKNGSASGLERRVTRALDEYAAELKEWTKDSKLKVSLLSPDTIFEAFSVADADCEPGLRLYFEYLQCEDWDSGFYNMLVKFKDDAITKLEIGGAGKKRRPSPVRNDGSTAAKLGNPKAVAKVPEAIYKPHKPRGVMEEFPGPNAKTEFVKTNFDAEPTEKKNGVGKKVEAKSASKTTNGGLATAPKGDLAAAKAFSAEVKKSGGASSTRPLPPHLRVKK